MNISYDHDRVEVSSLAWISISRLLLGLVTSLGRKGTVLYDEKVD